MLSCQADREERESAKIYYFPSFGYSLSKPPRDIRESVYRYGMSALFVSLGRVDI